MSDYDFVNRSLEQERIAAEEKTKRIAAASISLAVVLVIAIFFAFFAYRSYVHRNDPRMASGPFMCYEVDPRTDEVNKP